MKTCPCVKCENKGCGSFHDKCESYQEWQKERNAAREYNHKIQDLNNFQKSLKMDFARKKERGK